MTGLLTRPMPGPPHSPHRQDRSDVMGTWTASRATLAALLLALLLAACSAGTVVLLPQKDAHATAVVVTQPSGVVVLDQPYAAAVQTPFGAPRAYTATPQEVQTQFGAALAAQPMRPTQFTLYFVEGKDELTDESKQIVDGVFAEIAKRPVPDVLVVGHTDALGSDQANDVLSQQRADTIRAALIDRGIAAENIQAIGRGKRDAIAPAAKGVAEPLDRRVDIVVR